MCLFSSDIMMQKLTIVKEVSSSSRQCKNNNTTATDQVESGSRLVYDVQDNAILHIILITFFEMTLTHS